MIDFLRRNGFNIVLLICVVGFVAWQRVPLMQHGQSLEGMALPDVTVTSLDGKALRLSDYREGTVLLSFWATWCLPCRVERPALIGLKEEFNDKKFEILGISDEAPAVLKKFLEKNQTNFPTIVDQRSALHELFGISSYPTVVAVHNGKVVSVSHGVNPFLKFKIRHQVTGSYF